jgi:hypothetical protein
MFPEPENAILVELRAAISPHRYHDQVQVKAGHVGVLLRLLDVETDRADTETRRVQLLNQLIEATQPSCKATAPACRS